MTADYVFEDRWCHLHNHLESGWECNQMFYENSKWVKDCQVKVYVDWTKEKDA